MDDKSWFPLRPVFGILSFAVAFGMALVAGGPEGDGVAAALGYATVSWVLVFTAFVLITRRIRRPAAQVLLGIAGLVIMFAWMATNLPPPSAGSAGREFDALAADPEEGAVWTEMQRSWPTEYASARAAFVSASTPAARRAAAGAAAALPQTITRAHHDHMERAPDAAILAIAADQLRVIRRLEEQDPEFCGAYVQRRALVDAKSPAEVRRLVAIRTASELRAARLGLEAPVARATPTAAQIAVVRNDLISRLPDPLERSAVLRGGGTPAQKCKAMRVTLESILAAPAPVGAALAVLPG